jgi:tetratricopeptide (TPR) repeat protein
MSQYLNIFVSSTSDDLREYRAAVRDAILELGQYPVMMENWPAEGVIAVEKCRRALSEAHIYVGLYAHRYGWIPTPDQGGDGASSITALEYQWAADRKLPRLCFLIQADHPWPHRPPHVDKEPEKKALLDQFKQRVSSETIRKEFTTPDDLARQVMAALVQAIKDITGQEPPTSGWRRLTAPPLAQHFIGRATDRAEIGALLRADGEPVIAVRGAGGIGKTYLARQLSRDLAADFPGGVLWAGLGPEARHTDIVLATVLPEWGQASPNGRNLDPSRVTAAQVRNLLSGAPGRLLAVLDDVWVPEVARKLQEALPAGTACLLTTRSPRIAALGGHNYTLSKLDHADGCALLEDRLRVANLNPDPHAAALREIARLVDGHALALDLAARQLIERGVDFAPRFVERLKKHLGGATPFKLLELGEGQTRDDSLEAALYLSYEPLSEDAQAKFRALGVLAPDTSFADRTAFAVWGVRPHIPAPSPHSGEGESSGDSVGAGLQTRPHEPDAPTDPAGAGRPSPLAPLPQGEGNMGDEPDPLEAAEDALADLLRMGLIMRIPDTSRCDMHMLVLTYAGALARRASEYDAALGRYTKHVIHDIAWQFRDLPPEKWEAEILPDKDHIHHVGDLLAGYIQAVVLGETPLDALAMPDPPENLDELRAEITSPPAPLSASREGESSDDTVGAGLQTRPHASDDSVGAIHELPLPRATPASPPPGGEVEGRMIPALLERGENFAAAVYNYVFRRPEIGEKGRRWLRTGLACARLRAHRDREGLFTAELALWHDHRGQKQAALDYNQASLVISRAVGDRAGEATTLNNIGGVYNALGQKQRALDYYDQALPIMREVGDRAGEAATLNNIGGVYNALGQKQRALDYYDQALPIRREVGDRAGEATTLNNMAGVYVSIGQIEKGRELLEQAFPIQREVGDRAGETSTLLWLADIHHRTGDPAEALELQEQVLVIMREVGDRAGEATTLNNIGGVYDDLGQKQRALDYYDQALPIRREVGDRAGEATTLNNMAVIYYGQGEYTRTADMLRQVIQIDREVGNVASEALHLYNLAMVLYHGLGQTDEPIALVTRALAILEQYNLPQDAGGITPERYRAFLAQLRAGGHAGS